MVPAPLATAVRRGIALEILEAPREYGLACGSELLEAPIRLARRGRSGTDGVVVGDPVEPERARVEAPEVGRPPAELPPMPAAPVAAVEPAPSAATSAT